MSASQGPIFLAGVDRSGIGLMGELLDAHPNIAISRRTNFWTFYYRRFGDLQHPQNLERCLAQMTRYTRMQALQPDRAALLAALGGQPPTYGRLFALMQEQHIRRLGKSRWGDKSLDSEGHADAIFHEFPDAVIVHVIRDPRDRYASQAAHRRAARGQVGSGIALWRWSARLARRNLARHPGRYMVVRYEDLVTRPGRTLRHVCDAVGEDFAPEMLQAAANDGDEVPADRRPREFTTASIERFRRDLTPRETVLIDLIARHGMRAFGYAAAGIRLTPREGVVLGLVDVPLTGVRMAGWRGRRAWSSLSGPRPAARRIAGAAPLAGGGQTK